MRVCACVPVCVCVCARGPACVCASVCATVRERLCMCVRARSSVCVRACVCVFSDAYTLSPVQIETVSVRSETPIRATPSLSEVSPILHLKQVQCSSDWPVHYFT